MGYGVTRMNCVSLHIQLTNGRRSFVLCALCSVCFQESEEARSWSQSPPGAGPVNHAAWVIL
jgi:hypothetical protein